MVSEIEGMSPNLSTSHERMPRVLNIRSLRAAIRSDLTTSKPPNSVRKSRTRYYRFPGARRRNIFARYVHTNILYIT